MNQCPSGLIYGFAFSPEQPARSINSEAALTWLGAPRDNDNPEFIWLHFNRSNVHSEKWLKEHLALPEHGSLRRVFVRLRRLLAPEPGSLFRLLNHPPDWFDEEDTEELRAASEEFSAVLNDISALQERAKLLQEEITAHITEETNRSVFLLTMVTVLALPINIIAGLLGMNVGGIPLAQDPNGL
ncbi:zinc transporter [Gammaproteobacteria bacterium]